MIFFLKIKEVKDKDWLRQVIKTVSGGQLKDRHSQEDIQVLKMISEASLNLQLIGGL